MKYSDNSPDPKKISKIKFQDYAKDVEDNLYVSKNNQQQIKPINLFPTPLWYIEKDLPEGAYEWALDIEKNVEGTVMSLSLIHI